MDDISRIAIEGALFEWEISESAWFALMRLPPIDPTEYMPLLPDALHVALGESDLVREPPQSTGDIDWIESAVHSAKYFGGLTEAEGTEKIQSEKQRRQERIHEVVWRLHDYFVRAV